MDNKEFEKRLKKAGYCVTDDEVDYKWILTVLENNLLKDSIDARENRYYSAADYYERQANILATGEY